jgi:hypothetical protein
MPTPTNSTDLLTATISFRLSEDEYRSLNSRADREHRTVSNLCRMLLRNIVPSPAEPTQRQE